MKKIGLFGFGTVGKGFYENLTRQPDVPATIAKVCVRRVDLERISHELYFTDEANELLEDPDIDIIVEVIDDAIAAKTYVKRALEKGKHVISANKKMIAESLQEVDGWHQTYATSFLYEAAVGGGIPIVNAVDGIFRDQGVTKIRGILNGSSNYILTQMNENNWSYDSALEEAQRIGFAEQDPTLDVSGMDALYKLIILSYHAFGKVISPEACQLEGIAGIRGDALNEAVSKGLKIKPIVTAKLEGDDVICFGQPEQLDSQDEFYGVDFENNAVSVETLISGRHISVGKGAGALPTGSSVMEDLKRILKGFKYQVALGTRGVKEKVL